MLIQTLINNPILVNDGELQIARQPFCLLMNSNTFITEQKINEVDNFKKAHRPYEKLDTEVSVRNRTQMKLNQYFSISSVQVCNDWNEFLALDDLQLKIGDQVLRYKVTNGSSNDFFARVPEVPRWIYLPTNVQNEWKLVQSYINHNIQMRPELCHPSNSNADGISMEWFTAVYDEPPYNWKCQNFYPDFLQYWYTTNGTTVSDTLNHPLDKCRAHIMLNGDILANAECKIERNGDGIYTPFTYTLLLAGGPTTLIPNSVVKFY